MCGNVIPSHLELRSGCYLKDLNKWLVRPGLLIIHDSSERHRTLIANFHYESRSARRTRR